MVTLIVRMLKEKLVLRSDVAYERSHNILAKSMDEVDVYRKTGINLAADYHCEVGVEYSLCSLK